MEEKAFDSTIAKLLWRVVTSVRCSGALDDSQQRVTQHLTSGGHTAQLSEKLASKTAKLIELLADYSETYSSRFRNVAVILELPQLW